MQATEGGLTNVEWDLTVYEAYQSVSNAELGRQIMDDVNPVLIKKCTDLPSNFPVTNKMLQDVMASVLTTEMKLCLLKSFKNIYIYIYI